MNKSTFVAASRLSFLFCVLAFCLGSSNCSKPSEYCKKAYTTKKNRLECTNFCKANKAFSTDHPSKEALDHRIRSCEHGQRLFLTDKNQVAQEAMRTCDQMFGDYRDIAAACRDGVTAEELRTSKQRSGPGTANDRETGNNKERETGNNR